MVDECPPRAYIIPKFKADGALMTQADHEPIYRFLTMSQVSVEEMLLRTETKNSLIDLADTNNIPIKRSKGRASIAVQVAMALCKPLTVQEKQEIERVTQYVEPEPELQA